MSTTNGKDEGLKEPGATFETKVITVKEQKKTAVMLQSHLCMYIKCYLSLCIKILYIKKKTEK